MTDNLAQVDFQRLWKRLQQLGLNAYESRCYLVLVGHPKFKALELASRAQVPRQKIYEVLDSLAEKGFAQVAQDKTKLFSAVEPKLAVPGFLARRHDAVAKQLREQTRLGEELIADLNNAYHSGQEGRGRLDYLRVVNDPFANGSHYRSMITGAQKEYLEFSRPPFDLDAAGEQLMQQARQRGVVCRVLVERSPFTDKEYAVLAAYAAAGVEVRQADTLPMRLSLFDGKHGMIALPDPITTQQAWTSVVFDHPSMGEAMKGVFEAHWSRSTPMGGTPRSLGASG